MRWQRHQQKNQRRSARDTGQASPAGWEPRAIFWRHDNHTVLISLHLPKTAGTSFLAVLEQHFGESLYRDYDDRPLHHGALRRHLRCTRAALTHSLSGLAGEPACIHGHFLPLKYRYLRSSSDLRFVTWFRDPVQRIVSHYNYWRREYEAATAGALHRKVVEEDWSLERFALSPELRDVYRLFLWHFPLQRFDFIGITEFFEEDLQDFASRFLGATAAPDARNAGPAGVGLAHAVEAELEARIRQYHIRDVALYEKALEMRRQRLCD
jgi:hypothetical protein